MSLSSLNLSGGDLILVYPVTFFLQTSTAVAIPPQDAQAMYVLTLIGVTLSLVSLFLAMLMFLCVRYVCYRCH